MNSSNRCCCKICFSGFLLKAILRGSFTTLPVVQSIHLITTYRLFSIKWRQQISSLDMTGLPLLAWMLENSKQLFFSPLPLNTEACSEHSDWNIFCSNASSRLTRVRFDSCSVGHESNANTCNTMILNVQVLYLWVGFSLWIV